MPFRRDKRDKRAKSDEVDVDLDQTGLEQTDLEPDDEPAEPASAASSDSARRTRPFDETEVADPEGGAPFPRLDLGSMRIPVFAEMEVRVELNDAKQPVAASLLHAGSAVQ